ncbi:peroxiredoxin family protein [Guyparkeria sp.]|uniref:peroxiredoxin family protein n=1 Tax=Guyparkeria sp. TaxID=2035736 RepID=UPI0035663318
MTLRTDKTPTPNTPVADSCPDPARRRLLLGGAGALAAVGLGGCLSGSGLDLSDATVRDLDGKEIALDSIKGSPTVITFWATTCPGCVEEIPHIQELHDTYSPRGVDVIGLAMSYDPVEQIKKMVEQKDMTYTIWHDTNEQGAQAFGPVRVTPTFFILDSAGRIEYQKIGLIDMDRVRGILDGLTA